MAEKNVAGRTLEAIEVARSSGGSLKKGVNEVTKAIERQTAKLVAYAADVSPKEIIMHLPLLAKEKGVLCVEVKSREELGTAAGIPVPTSAVAVIAEGDAKNIIKEIREELGA